MPSMESVSDLKRHEYVSEHLDIMYWATQDTCVYTIKIYNYYLLVKKINIKKDINIAALWMCSWQILVLHKINIIVT
jgi:hypothetical protein